MIQDELRSQIELVAEEIGIEITERQIKKFVNMSAELIDECDISFDEIVEDLTSISPNDEDDWLDFIESIAKYIEQKVMDSYDYTEDEEDE